MDLSRVSGKGQDDYAPLFFRLLPHRLEQHNSSGHRHVQAFDVALHRDRRPASRTVRGPAAAGPLPSAPSTIARGSVKSISSYARRRVARQPDRPDSRLLQLVERARDVHHGRRSARAPPRRPTLSPTTPSSDAACRACRTTPCPPAASTRAQNRADVVRILDAVEHHEQRRVGAAAGDELLDRRIPRRHDAPRPRPDARRRARRGRARCAIDVRSTATPGLPRPARRSRPSTRRLTRIAVPYARQRFAHGVDAADQHALRGTRMSMPKSDELIPPRPAALTARQRVHECRARSRQPTIGATPASGAAAPRRDRSPAPPDPARALGLAGQRDANRMEQRPPLLPGPLP